MFFKRTPEEGKGTHIIYSRAGGRVRIQVRRREEKRERMGKEWAGMGKEADYGSGKKHQDLF